MSQRAVVSTAATPEHPGPVLDRINGFEVVDCAACGFAHIAPVPTADELRRVYSEDYYSSEKPLYLERHREDADWWALVHDERLDTLASLATDLPRRLLDVGSGPGLFLQRAQARGWEAVGVEPSRQAAAHSASLGVPVVNDFLSAETAPRLGRFGAVHLSEVLEHIPDPAAMLGLIHGLLEPGGVLCVAVPNDYSPVQRALREAEGFAPWWVVPPHHINYFNPDTLAALVARCGFEVAAREATFPIDLFLLMGENYVGDDALGRRCHGRRKRLELTLESAGLREWKRGLYRALAEHGLGRETLVYARRAEEGA